MSPEAEGPWWFVWFVLSWFLLVAPLFFFGTVLPPLILGVRTLEIALWGKCFKWECQTCGQILGQDGPQIDSPSTAEQDESV